MTRHHPSTIASPGTATSGRRDVYNDNLMAAAVNYPDWLRRAHAFRDRIVRDSAIAGFSEQHDAPSSLDDWDDDLKMMFAIQHPDVIL